MADQGAGGSDEPPKRPDMSSPSSGVGGAAGGSLFGSVRLAPRGRGLSTDNSVGWHSLADLSEFELDGDIDSDLSGKC